MCAHATQPSLLVKQSASVLTATSHSALIGSRGTERRELLINPVSRRSQPPQRPALIVLWECRGAKSSEGDTERSGAAATNSFAICASLGGGERLENASALAHKGERVAPSNKRLSNKKGRMGNRLSGIEEVLFFFCFFYSILFHQSESR